MFAPKDDYNRCNIYGVRVPVARLDPPGVRDGEGETVEELPRFLKLGCIESWTNEANKHRFAG